jgi:hypothetical protein
MTNPIKPNAEVADATQDLMRAAAKFARLASDQYAQEQPKDYESIAARVVDGTAELVVVVSVGLGGAAQLCADQGSQRHIVCTVQTGKASQP